MKKSPNGILSSTFLILLIGLGECQSQSAIDQQRKTADPTYHQRLSEKKLNEWQNLKYGMFIHFGMSTFLGEELPEGNAPIEKYDPSNLNVAQWVKVAKEAGMKYAVLTAKHVAGHCLWPSNYTHYDVAHSKNTLDVVGEFVKECRAQGIEPGIYYCAWDNHHTFGSWMPGKSENYNGASATPTESQPVMGAPFTSHLYQNFMTAQIDELLERYSPLVEFWTDIPIILGDGYRQFLYDHITEKYPEMLVIMNHGQKKQGNKLMFQQHKAWPTDAFTLERFSPEEAYDPVWSIAGEQRYLPAESNMPIGNEWFWEADDVPKPISELVQQFQICLDNKVNFLLNVPPDKTGQIPEKWISALMELKEKMGGRLK
jgi:alpha-L-fucosidase